MTWPAYVWTSSSRRHWCYCNNGFIKKCFWIYHSSLSDYIYFLTQWIMRAHLTSHGTIPSCLHAYTLTYVGKYLLRYGEVQLVQEQRKGWKVSKGGSPDLVPSGFGQEEEETWNQRILALQGWERSSPSLPPSARTPRTGSLTWGFWRQTCNRCLQIPMLCSPICCKVLCDKPKLAVFTSTHCYVLEYSMLPRWPSSWLA